MLRQIDMFVCRSKAFECQRQENNILGGLHKQGHLRWTIHLQINTRDSTQTDVDAENRAKSKEL